MAKVNPIQLQKALKGVNYPASKQDLLRRAESNKADQNIRNAIQRLPEQQYNRPSDVSKAIGQQE